MSFAGRTLVVVLTNSGGEGKTTWTESLECLADFAGLSTLVVDLDPGNRGFRNRNGEGSAFEMHWDIPPYEDSNGGDWIRNQFATYDLIIADTGANFLLAGSKASQFLGEAAMSAHAGGARVVFHAVTSPNKAGSGGLVENICARYGTKFETAVIRCDRDGSSSFQTGLDAIGAPVVDVGHLEPGFQAYRLSRQEPLSKLIRNPTPGFEVASAYIADWLEEMANNSHVCSLIGGSVRDALSPFTGSSPGPLFYVVSTLRRVSNGSLGRNAECYAAAASFKQSSPEQEELFLDAAKRLWRARKDWAEYG